VIRSTLGSKMPTTRWVRHQPSWVREAIAPEEVPTVPMRIAFPFCGLDGPGRALKEMQVPYIADHVYDIEKPLERVVKLLYDQDGNHHPLAFNFGKEEGDMTSLDLEGLRDVEGLCAGFPCPPWSMLGKRRSHTDPRARCARRLMDWIEELANRGTLRWFMLENVLGIGVTAEGEEKSFLDGFLEWAAEAIPGWVVRPDVVDAHACGLPQSRNRYYITGVRRLLLLGDDDAFLSPTMPLRYHSLLTVLEPFTPPVEWRTELYRKNAAGYELKYQTLRATMMERGETPVAIAVGDCSRQPAKKGFCSALTKDKVPCLTTGNGRLSLHGHPIPGVLPVGGRWLSDSERCSASGVVHASLSSAGLSSNQITKYVGNAMPVNACGVVLAAIMKMTRRFEVAVSNFESNLEFWQSQYFVEPPEVAPSVRIHPQKRRRSSDIRHCLKPRVSVQVTIDLA